MNRKLLSIALFFSVVLLFSGCKKDETTDPGTSSLASGQSQISCSVSGAASSSFSSNLMLSTVLKSTSLINISGSSLNGLTTEIVMIILPADATPGTYTSASHNSGNLAFSYSKGSDAWAADVDPLFTIVVTSASSTEIAGTFSGTITNDDMGSQVTVTNGKFAAKY
jgi:hypothetical protein